MYDVFGVHVDAGMHQLVHDVTGLRLGETPLFHDAIEELSAPHVFHHEEESLFFFDHVFKIHNARMSQTPKNLHLRFQGRTNTRGRQREREKRRTEKRKPD